MALDMEIAPPPAQQGSFSDDYEITGRVLGSGMSGDVKLAVHKQTGRKVAMKTFQLNKMSARSQADLSREIQVQSSIQHPNVAKLEGVYRSKESVVMALEYLGGGDVFEHLLEQEGLDELGATSVLKQLLSAVGHMHAQGFVHRDIKPENMVYSTADRDTLKLIDFGLCAHWKDGKEKMTRRCGTEEYMAPEVLRKCGYDKSADMWSVGAFAHVLLTGEMIGRKSDWTPDLSSRLSMCSDEAQKFVKGLLIVDPAMRMTASEALQHSWLHRQHEPQDRASKFENQFHLTDSTDASSIDTAGYDELEKMGFDVKVSVQQWKHEFPCAIVPDEAPKLKEKRSVWKMLPTTGMTQKVGTVLAALRRTRANTRVSPEMQIVPHASSDNAWPHPA